MTDQTETDQPALFDVTPVVASDGAGRVERMLMAAITAGKNAGTLIDEDLGMIGGALAGARAIDQAERWPGTKGGYLVAQLLTPYREALAALRLPAAVQPAETGRPAVPTSGDAPSWLGDEFGTPGD